MPLDPVHVNENVVSMGVPAHRVEGFVDALPQRWWRPGNLYLLRGHDVHFCVDAHPRLGHTVRTIECEGRVVAHGRRPFDRETMPAPLWINRSALPWLIDRVPDRLWRRGGLGYGYVGLDFDVEHAEHGRSVRTLSWRARVLGRGTRPHD